MAQAQGKTVVQVCKQIGVTEQTDYLYDQVFFLTVISSLYSKLVMLKESSAKKLDLSPLGTENVCREPEGCTLQALWGCRDFANSKSHVFR